jgi:hypothetical protein
MLLAAVTTAQPRGTSKAGAGGWCCRCWHRWRYCDDGDCGRSSSSNNNNSSSSSGGGSCLVVVDTCGCGCRSRFLRAVPHATDTCLFCFFHVRSPACSAVLVGLYEEPERPPNAVDYIKRYMGAPTGIDIEAMRAENETLRKEREELRTTIEELNGRLQEQAADE